MRYAYALLAGLSVGGGWGLALFFAILALTMPRA